MRVEHEYEHGGALAYLVAWDVHRARLFGRCEATTGIAPFGSPGRAGDGKWAYASAARVFWVVENGSSHRGQASIEQAEKSSSNYWRLQMELSELFRTLDAGQAVC
jgi:hypothetical protein